VTANFSPEATTGCSGVKLDMTNQTSSAGCSTSNMQYQWTVSSTNPESCGTSSSQFSTGTSTSTSPEIQFNGPGVYNVQLQAQLSPAVVGCSTSVINKTITIGAAPTVSSITAPSVVCQNQSASFSANVNACYISPSNFSWSFPGNLGPTPAGPITGTFNQTATQSTSTVFGNHGTGAVQLTVSNSCGSATSSHNITVNQAAVTNVSPVLNVCNSDVINLSGSISGGTTQGVWSISPANSGTLSNSGTFSSSPQNTLSVNSTYTGNIVLTLTSSDPDGSGPCLSTNDSETFIVSSGATANAGVDQSICAGQTITLSGSIGAPATTGSWTTLTAAPNKGTFSNAGSLNTTYTPSSWEISNGSVTLVLTTNNPDGPCEAAQDQVTVTIKPLPTVVASVPNTACSGTAYNVSLVPSTTAFPATYTWSVVSPSPLPANFTTTTSGSVTSGNSFTTTSTNNTTSNQILVTYSVVATINGCSGPADTANITIFPQTTANAGVDQTICSSGTVSLGGAVGGGATTGTWSGGSGTYAPNASTLSTVYTPSLAEIAAGNFTLTLTSNDPPGPCLSVTDQIQITINPKATVNAGIDQTICSNSTATLAGVFGGGATSATWTTSGSGTFSNATSMSAVYTPSAADISAGSVNLILSTNDPAGSCDAVADQLTLTINPAATVNAGVDQALCSNGTVTLAGAIGGGATSASWSGGNGTFNPNNTTLTAVYTPSTAEATAGSVNLTLTSNDPTGPCGVVTDQIQITISPAATVNAGVDQTICSTSTATLAGNFGGGATSATWTTSGSGTFSNATSMSAIYTPSAADISAGSVLLTLTSNDPAGPCPIVSDNLTLTINQAATVNAGIDQTICAGGSVSLAGIIGGGATTAAWSGGSGTYNPNSTTLNTVYTPSASEITSGIINLTLTSNDPTGPCGIVTDQIQITINP
jgi:hypothetical protein